jgi:Helix-turn-helix domain
MATITFDTDELADKIIARIESKLTSITQHPTVNDPDELLTLQKCAEADGRSIFTWYGVTSRGEIPYIKKGRKVYITRRDLMAYMRTPNVPKPKKEKKEYTNEIPQ